MLNNFVLTVALRYFSAKKNERFVSVISAFSLIGVTIGVAALIVVMSVMNGFHLEFTRNIIGLNGDINITARNNHINDYQLIINTLSKQNYIKKVTPIITGQALAIGKKTNSGVLIKGINLLDLEHKEAILNNIRTGQFADFHNTNVIAIGTELAYHLGVRVGDNLKLIAPNTIATFMGSMPRSKSFKIVAIFNSGMYDYDAGTILMPLEGARNFFNMTEGVNLIEVNTSQPDQADQLSKTIRLILAESLKHTNTQNPEIFENLLDNLRITSWSATNMQFLRALAVERIAMFTILSLIILVAAFNIISSLFMLVKDKTKDIAILKTIGASQKHIMAIFIVQGMMIGIIGTVSGIVLGLSFAYNIERIRQYLEQVTNTKIFEAAIYFLYTLPSEVRIQDVLLISTVALILSFLATIFPSYKASKLNPVEILRYA